MLLSDELLLHVVTLQQFLGWLVYSMPVQYAYNYLYYLHVHIQR